MSSAIRLAQRGVNVLQLERARAARAAHLSLRTLIPEGAAHERMALPRGAPLGAVRHRQHRARHALGGLQQPGPALWARVRAQVTAFFEALEDEGAFVGAAPRRIIS